MSKEGNDRRADATENAAQSLTYNESAQFWQEKVTGRIYGPGSFGEVSCEWLRLLTPQLKQASIAKYINVLNSYLLPKFQERKIEDIGRSEVSAFASGLLLAGGKKVADCPPGRSLVSFP